uniref:HlyD family secretion protein n=1 Tax=Ningiella ruwaisensis TaxID=2364274 RepID=UPI00109FBAF0|nr:HlyD family efflux transporter periplasmic adaptor subunit [Ningiella ruwaisensis]
MQKSLVVIISILLFFPALAKEVILTGQISSSARQVVNAPQASRWQIQIQWMEEEGKVVNEGDLVVVFDGANEQSQLEQNIESLARLRLELEQLQLDQDQRVTDAQGRLTLAKMEVEKAQIEASVPAAQVSAYDKGQYDLALQRALLEQVKAQEALASAIKERTSELQKKNIDILKTEEEIAYLEDLLTKMNVIAEHTGPVTYAMHPWSNDKLAAGMNVQASWKVLDVQAIESFQVETWIHEVDALGISAGMPVKLTLDAHPSISFDGKIEILSTQTEPKDLWSSSAYYPAIISFTPPENIKLLPGMSVRILPEDA